MIDIADLVKLNVLAYLNDKSTDCCYVQKLTKRFSQVAAQLRKLSRYTIIDMTCPITSRTRKIISSIEDSEIREKIVYLISQAESSFPKTESSLERIHCAVIKLVIDDQVGGFDRAKRLYNADYRDLLMNAGFGHDLEAHNEWADSYLSGRNV